MSNQFTDQEAENFVPPPCPDCGDTNVKAGFWATVWRGEQPPANMTWSARLFCSNPNCDRSKHGWNA